MKKRINVFKVLTFLFLIIWSISIISLLIWGVLSSVKDPLFDFRKNVLGLPKEWKFSNYAYVYDQFKVEVLNKSTGIVEKIGMLQQALYTIIFCLCCAFFGTIIPCTVGYLLANYKYKFSNFLNHLVLVLIALPIIGATPAELALLKSLGIYDTFFGICLQRCTFLGVYLFVFEATFMAVPYDFYEAAMLDGSSDFGIYLKIMLPMAWTTFFTIFLLIFVQFWNDYQYPLIYLPSRPTLSYGLYMLSNSTLQGLNNVPMRMAGVVIVMMPILILFIIFKDKLVGNISMGGVKE